MENKWKMAMTNKAEETVNQGTYRPAAIGHRRHSQDLGAPPTERQRTDRQG